MSIVKRILGESSTEWPKILTSSIPIRDLVHAYELWDNNSGSYDRRSQIEGLINYDELKRQIYSLQAPPPENPLALANSGDILFHDGEEEPCFETDDGLIFDSAAVADSVVSWLDVGFDSSDWVMPLMPGCLQTRNSRTSKCIGTWLESIGVPFEYNIEPD